MKLESKIALWITLNNVSLKKQWGLIHMFHSLIELWNSFENNKNLKDYIGADNYLKMEEAKDDNYLNQFIRNCENEKIKIITFYDEEYPKLLKEIDLPPIVLYCKGDVSLLNSKCFSIVGTRRISRYGADTTKSFANALSRAGLTIVSGLADGVDTVAHTQTLESGGKTIAVLGCGLNEIYPQANTNLAHNIMEKGLVVSEYKPNEKPQTYYFPQRNRIIAGLSVGLLITEATEKSGSMHTKNFALEYGRDLFAVPGRITDIYSYGTNKIIKNLQSSMVLSPSDIINYYGLNEILEKKQAIQVDFNDEIVLSLISADELHYEEILSKSGMEPKKLNTILTRLELKGLVKKLSGNFYSK